MRGQLVQAVAVLVLVLYSSSTAEARKTAHNLKHAPKNNDAAHASRKYTRHTDPLSGRSGAAHQPHSAPVGRKLRQSLAPTDIMPGMSMCPSAADAANFIVGAHATQLAVSNAAWTAGACDITTCARDPVSNLVSCSTGLQWGVVQTWPADHALAAVFGNSGGLVLGSGQATEVARAVNDMDDFTADNQLAGDTDLDALIPGYTTYDAAVLEFDVVPAKSGDLVFSWVLSSEEYNEWVDTAFNDVFGFWVSGPGISAPDGSSRVMVAYMPDQVTPCSINNVNNGKFSQYYNDNDADPRPTVYPTPSRYNTSYDGFTTLLNTRPVSVQAGQKYHFKLAVADAGDHILDTAVVIAGSSLLVNNPPKVVTDGPFTLSCPGSVTMHANGTDDDHDDIRYYWDLRSTTGAHLTRMTQDPVLTNPTDAIPAGSYTVVLTAIDVHGSRTSTTSSLTVLPCPAPAGNRPPTAQLTGAPYTLAVCNGVGSMTLDASGSSDPDAGDSIARYVWEVSSSDFELKLNGPTPTVGAANGLFAGNVYEVEVYVSDTYGAVGVAETTLTVVPAAGCSAGGGGCTGSNCNPPPTTLTEAVITGGPYTMACPGSTVLDASQSTAFDGNTAALSYSWAFYNAASGQGFVLDAGNQATYQLLLSSQAEMQLGETWSVEVTVTDSQGWQAYADTTLSTPTSCNTAPKAVVTPSTYTVPCNGPVSLDGTASSDPDAGDSIAVWSWEVRNKAGALVTTGSTSVLNIAPGTLPAGATYYAYLTVTDTQGASTTSSQVTITAQTCNVAPVAKLSGGALSMSCGGTVKLDGTSSSDPNGNDDIAGYTFEVLNPSTLAVVATKQSPSTSGKANFTMADGLSGNTNYLVRLTVADKQGASGTANQTLAVGNCAPTAAMAVTPSATVACSGSATLDASGSKDTDGSIASYSWKLVNGNQTIAKSGVTAAVSQSTDKLTPGATYAVTLTVKDNTGSSAVATGSLGVQAGCVAPNNPPVCTNAKPSVTRISTLNHSMVTVNILNVVDPDGDAITLSVTGVTQNEGTKASDTGITGTWACPDAKKTTVAGQVQVAAECLKATSTSVTGRVYIIAFTATDSKGAACSGFVQVCARPGTTGSCPTTGTTNSLVCA